jgi:hypothetical protein
MGDERNRGTASGNQSGNGGDKSGAGETGAQKSGADAAAAIAAAARASGAGTGTGTATDAAAAAAAAAPKGTGNNATVNPTALTPDNYERDAAGNVVYQADGVTPRKKRGRKPGQSYGGGSATAPKSAPAKTDKARAAVATEMLAAQFQILNVGIAYLTKFEDFKLDDAEAMQMAESTANVMAQFDYVPDPKVAAILGLVTTTSMIYGPRCYLLGKHRQALKAEKQRGKIESADESVATGGTYQPGFTGPMNTGQFSG